MAKLSNKIALITGASSGIGKACAMQLAAEGCNVILAARRTERLHSLENEIKTSYNVKVLSLSLDVKSNKKVQTAIESLPDEFKNIDILVNNAGLGLGLETLLDGSVENWDSMIDTNLKGLLYVTKAIIPIMAERKKGHIVNLGSTAGHEVYPKGNVYCATKFAVKAITKALRMELLDKYIRVTTIDPGMVETEFSQVRFNGDIERAKNVYKGIEPLVANDIADAVVYAVTRPQHVNIAEIIITPSAQATAQIVHREA